MKSKTTKIIGITFSAAVGLYAASSYLSTKQESIEVPDTHIASPTNEEHVNAPDAHPDVGVPNPRYRGIDRDYVRQSYARHFPVRHSLQSIDNLLAQQKEWESPIVYVMDTSGSTARTRQFRDDMETSERMEYLDLSKIILTQLIGQLSDEYFNIIQYSTHATAFRQTNVSALEHDDALRWIQSQYSLGGTSITHGLVRATECNPRTIVLLSDDYGYYSGSQLIQKLEFIRNNVRVPVHVVFLEQQGEQANTFLELVAGLTGGKYFTVKKNFFSE